MPPDARLVAWAQRVQAIAQNGLAFVRDPYDRERSDGGWALPGGWADVGESVASAVEREVHEESGIECRAVRVPACWDRRRQGHPPSIFHSYKIALRCEPRGGAPAPSLEASDAGFFTEDEIPGLELSVARTMPAQIARVFEHFRQPDLPTDFD